ncbi:MULTISPECIES: hypothetical protein [Vibrio]|jgi:hypothetical protein|nr:hypothetical protein [Vibrio sp. PID17_43]
MDYSSVALAGVWGCVCGDRRLLRMMLLSEWLMCSQLVNAMMSANITMLCEEKGHKVIKQTPGEYGNFSTLALDELRLHGSTIANRV